jgi:hypothetical protein
MYQINLPKILQPFYCADLIRLGKSNDGGYLINHHDMDKTHTLIGFGLGEDWSFEQEFFNHCDCNLVMYDGNVDPEKFTDYHSYLDFFNEKAQHLRKNIGNNEDSISCQQAIVNEHTFVKCDIEGNEYQILDELIKIRHKLSGLIMEFHDVNSHCNFDAMANFIAKIGMPLVHLHINNYFYYKKNNTAIPDILELTFTSSDNISYHPQLILPHRLDQVNNPQDSDFHVRF